ncbi:MULTISPECIES: hypothetical protein [unclassified Megasphaera]|uniref:hypothetical protein n=1 Tax=unclassified Megasphaera TaxID=2626256 RepID=UPI000EC96F18|nr:hypothetical protein [Megasphaera sp. UBA4233]HAM04431.1 hypothetical protein [Megasphaera sp.]
MTIIIAGVIIILGISFGIGILFKNNGTITLATCAAALVTFGIFVAMAAGIVFGYPVYKVWEQSKAGEAALAKATQDRQVKVQEAEAEMEAASKQAEANRILGQSVRDYPEAMEQKWVEAIEKTSNQVIYLPTEASIPVTESSRMAVKKQQEK